MDTIRNLLGRAMFGVQRGQSGQTTPSESTPQLPATIPSLVAHADWGTAVDKRWMTRAVRAGDRFVVGPPELVGDTSTLLRRLRSVAGEGPVMISFDFPIGVPIGYAKRAGVVDFLSWLPRLGSREWSRFYDVAERPEEISMCRPFYPQRPGGTRQHHLLDALEMGTIADLLRRCERANDGLPAASPLFWTMGAKQVGKAAISGWRDVLEPGLRDPELALVIWPFLGPLDDLLRPGHLVIVETYPAEFYHHLGVVWSRSFHGGKSGKGSQVARAANATPLLAWATSSGVDLHSDLQEAILDGFGSSSSGEDQFDATIGLFGMLNVLLGQRDLDEPRSEEICNIEGWIFGKRAT
jgi:hypothetical protein